MRHLLVLGVLVGGLLATLGVTGAPAPANDHTGWRDYAGGADASQYSALGQINRSNVKSLQVAWTYPTGDPTNYLFNPVIVGKPARILGDSRCLFHSPRSDRSRGSRGESEHRPVAPVTWISKIVATSHPRERSTHPRVDAQHSIVIA